MENKYHRGKIYKIVDVGYNKCYIGSTAEKLLSNRMSKHRGYYRGYKDGRRPYSSVCDLFDEFGLENCKIVWIKDFPCNNKNELEAEEGRIQQETECINKNVAGRTRKDYLNDNKEYIQARQQKYRENNKELIKEISRQYRENNKETIKEKREANKDYHKTYYLKNKERKKKQQE